MRSPRLVPMGWAQWVCLNSLWGGLELERAGPNQAGEATSAAQFP
jgi:hypothetical protein